VSPEALATWGATEVEVAAVAFAARASKVLLLSWFRQQICHRGRDMAVCGRG
jgi:hypothetical protein